MSNWKRFVLPGAALLAAFVVTFGAVYALLPSAAQPRPSESAPILIDPPRAMPDFSLTDQDGRTTRLSDFRGRAVVMFFGYTNCPDVCPLTLVEMLKARERLGADARRVAFVFVTVDGERDTPEALKRYLSVFDADFIGLTGAPDMVRVVAKDYGASFQKQKPKDTQAAYLMLHTASSYLLDADGRWRMTFAYGASPDTLVGGITSILP